MVGLSIVGAALGCGGHPLREEDIFHDPALRPTVVEAASEAERRLLRALGDEPPAGPLRVGDAVFRLGPSYDAASGRRCRRVEGAREELACQTPVGWRFVPSFGGF